MFSTDAATCLPCAQAGPSRAIDEGASPPADAGCAPRGACEEVSWTESRHHDPEVSAGTPAAATPANAASIHGLDVALAEPVTLPGHAIGHERPTAAA
jgi:hypothetical protein